MSAEQNPAPTPPSGAAAAGPGIRPRRQSFLTAARGLSITAPYLYMATPTTENLHKVFSMFSVAPRPSSVVRRPSSVVRRPSPVARRLWPTASLMSSSLLARLARATNGGGTRLGVP